METVIDLTLDDIDVHSWEPIDLTSVDDPHPSDYTPPRPEVKVEDESSTLVGLNTTDSGKSSPNTQRSDDAAQTESNPTDIGDLSPRNQQEEDSDSSDDLATVFARNRKRKNTSSDPPTSENKPSGTQLAPSALVPVFGSKSLKPAFGNLWFDRKHCVDDTGAARPQQVGRPKYQQKKSIAIQNEGQLVNDANSQILNVDLEEEFGPDKKPEKHKRKLKPQRNSTKRQS